MVFYEASPSDIKDISELGVLSISTTIGGMNLDLLEEGMNQFEIRKLEGTATEKSEKEEEGTFEEEVMATENVIARVATASATKSFAERMRSLIPEEEFEKELEYVTVEREKSKANEKYYTAAAAVHPHPTRRRRLRTIEEQQRTTLTLERSTVQNDPRYYTPSESGRSYSEFPHETTQQSILIDPWREVLESGTGFVDPRYTPKHAKAKRPATEAMSED